MTISRGRISIELKLKGILLGPGLIAFFLQAGCPGAFRAESSQLQTNATNVPPGSPQQESANGTTVPPATEIVDSTGTVWMLTSTGQILRNGVIDAPTNNVTKLDYHGGLVYQQAYGLWWYWSGGDQLDPSNGSGWTQASDPPGNPPPSPAPSPAPTPTPSQGSCGDEPPPPQAVAAGFTSCVANFDFTASTGSSWLPSQYAFSGPVSTTSNWLDCSGTNTSLPWHHGMTFGLTTLMPCNISVITDSSIGKTVLDIQYLEPYFATYGASMTDGQQNNVSMITETTNGIPTVSFPNFYVETIFKMTGAPNDTNTQGYSAIWSWQTGTGAIELDFSELYINVGSSSASAGDSAGHNWGGGPGAGFTWCSWASCDEPSNAANQNSPSNFNGSNYNIYGNMMTSDGATNSYSCTWVNGIFQSCGADGVPVAGNRWFLIDYDGAAKIGTVSSSDQYVQYIRVWSCPGWETGGCNGSTLVNGPPPAFTYYQ